MHEYVPGEELGVFYYRLPGDGRGRIFGTTAKRRPVVTGDGRRSLADLILDDPRLRCQRRVFARSLGSGLDRVPDDIRGPTMAEIRAVPALPALRGAVGPASLPVLAHDAGRAGVNPELTGAGPSPRFFPKDLGLSRNRPLAEQEGT